RDTAAACELLVLPRALVASHHDEPRGRRKLRERLDRGCDTLALETRSHQEEQHRLFGNAVARTQCAALAAQRWREVFAVDRVVDDAQLAVRHAEALADLVAH